MSLDSNTNRLYTVDGRSNHNSNPADDATLTSIDPATHTVVSRIPVYKDTQFVYADQVQSRVYAVGDIGDYDTGGPYTELDLKTGKTYTGTIFNNPGYKALQYGLGNPRGGLFVSGDFNVYVGRGNDDLFAYDSSPGDPYVGGPLPDHRF